MHRKHESRAEKMQHERSGMERALHRMGDHTRHKHPETKAERLEHERKGMLGHMKEARMSHKKHKDRAGKIAKGLMKEHMKHTAKDKIKFVMKEFKEDKLHSGSKKGPLVRNPKQAIAIAISESHKKRK